MASTTSRTNHQPLGARPGFFGATGRDSTELVDVQRIPADIEQQHEINGTTKNRLGNDFGASASF